MTPVAARKLRRNWNGVSAAGVEVGLDALGHAAQPSAIEAPATGRVPSAQVSHHGLGLE